MTVDELIAEGEALARPCLVLDTHGKGDLAGYWRGERSDRPNRVPPEATAIRSIEHIMTVDARLLEALGIPVQAATLGFSAVEPVHGDIRGQVLTSAAGISELQCSGLPLYAGEDTSFPPFEAICLYGSERVGAWLAGLGLQRHEYSQASDEAEAMDYQDHYLERSHIARSDAVAVLGGWHQLWPEDDFYMPLEMRLAILTLRDAEPWYELWQSVGMRNWTLRERIT